MRRLVLLGSTGSIGVNTLDCVRRLSRAGERWSLRGLSAFSNLDKLKDQIREFRPPRAVVGTDEGAIALRAWLRSRRIACRVDVGV
ncbi:MAG TPA: 1-deoxy-D-xylulose-5-phosphate reductoisomerase, partial [Elusimicrobiota bacterium]|nr:1-deoxy-D-xylulose-5-phosphate reductoisomerase [Elusimicrobiota bacterium]